MEEDELSQAAIESIIEYHTNMIKKYYDLANQHNEQKLKWIGEHFKLQN